MKKYYSLITLLALAGILFMLSIAFYGKVPSKNESKDEIKGFNLVAPRDKFPLDSLKAIQNTGAGWIAVVPYAFCDPETGSIVYGNNRQWWGETPDGIATTIQMAHGIGLKVMLKPHLWVRGQGWAGDLSFKTAAEWEDWEKNYAAYLATYTQIAINEGVEIYCIGTEIRNSTKNRSSYWEGLISAIKQNYEGKLTYAANWDEFEEVYFWNQLDFIGVDAYFPILGDKMPQVENLKTAWNEPKSRLEAVSIQYGKPILFTEYGYESIDYTAIGHWNVSKDSLSVNYEAQKNGYEALYQTFAHLDWWEGGFVWKWHLNLSGKTDRISKTYTPQQKPALQVISKHFKAH